MPLALNPLSLLLNAMLFTLCALRSALPPQSSVFAFKRYALYAMPYAPAPSPTPYALYAMRFLLNPLSSLLNTMRHAPCPLPSPPRPPLFFLYLNPILRPLFPAPPPPSRSP